MNKQSASQSQNDSVVSKPLRVVIQPVNQAATRRSDDLSVSK